MRRIAFLIFIVATSCKEKEPGICGVDDPVNDLPWLKAKIEFMKTDGGEEFRKMVYIMQGEYEGNVVFLDGNCCPYCLTLVQFYDCTGNKLNIDFDKLVNKKLIWKPDNSVCSF